MPDANPHRFDLYNNLPIGIFVIDSNYQILFWNLMMENFTDISAEEIIGSNLLERFPHLDKKMYRFRIDQIFDGGTPAIFSSQLHKYIIPCQLPNGEYRTQHTMVSRINCVETNCYNAVFSIQDVTEETKRINDYRTMRDKTIHEIEERKKVEDKLRESNVTKDKFFSIISHDLKNPFITLLGFSEMIVVDYDDFSSDEIKSYVHDIYKVANSTYKLLEDLLLWARSQQDAIKINKTQQHLSVIVDAVISTTQNMARRKDISLNNQIDDSHEIFVDEDTISTVIRNLISNSIKFTPKGGIVEISSLREGNLIKIFIKDNGVGIEENRLNKLFSLGETYSTEGTQNEKGTGLGLIMCKEFVEKNDGTISVESKVGEGTKFIISLPSKN